LQPIEINIPSSKSITQRAILCAALSNRKTIIKNPLYSEDTLLLINALKKLGTKISRENNKLSINGNSGNFPELGPREIYLGNNGTGFRFLTTLSGFYKNVVTITGNERMCQRPVLDLVETLKEIGFKIEYLQNKGFPPLKIFPLKIILKNEIEINASKSSQFVSSMLLSSPLFQKDFKLKLTGDIVSFPYIELTLDVMKRFGVNIERDNAIFYVKKGMNYSAQNFSVENDFSSASYFIGSSIVKNIPIKIENLFYNKSLQGDKHFIDIMVKMGANIKIFNNYIEVYGIKDKLNGIEINMRDLPDMVPTVAAIAAFAEGNTIIKDIEHLKYKETNRIDTVVKNLNKIGVESVKGENFIKIIPNKEKKFKSTLIDPENDHRIAMSFAIFTLFNENIKILDKQCVEKSFPYFWNEFEKLK
jgi:3-phosphoshikimate 1-carboxyvinyltransferase